MNENKKKFKDARVNRPERSQVSIHMYSLDQLLDKDHRARLVWQFVNGLDLTPLYEPIQVNKFKAGRSAIAPEILVALWLLATLDGIGSAREIERRCDTDIPYMWIRGEVGVNYHTLSSFRSGQTEFLDKVLVDSVATLVERGIVPLNTVAQDGMRVRASAGKSSFRRKPTLEKLQQEAAEHLERLQKENANEVERTKAEARRHAAEERVATDRKERIDEALRQYEELAAAREKREKGTGAETRVSTTDPDARKMKMANGGFDPAFNVQFVTDADSRMILSVDVTNEGTDGNQLSPIQEKVRKDYGKAPDNALVDSAFATKEEVTKVEKHGTKIVSTVPRAEQLKKNNKDPHGRQKGDTDEYADFRQRMSEESFQAMYRQRPSIAEFPNADCRNRNLTQFLVRGLHKVKGVALLHALAFNLLRMVNLGALEA